MWPGEEGRVKVWERSLGKVSVVQMARAVVSQASWVEARVEWATGTLLRILEMGRLDCICVSNLLACMYWRW